MINRAENEGCVFEIGQQDLPFFMIRRRKEEPCDVEVYEDYQVIFEDYSWK